MKVKGISPVEAISDLTHDARTAASGALFSFGQANMFAGSQIEGNGDMRASIESKLVSARRHVEDQLRFLEDAERVLSGPLNETRIEYLHRTTIDMEVLRAIPPQPKSEAPAASQLRALEVLGTRFGLYDAVDVLRGIRGDAPSGVPFSSVISIDLAATIKQHHQVQTSTNDQLHALEYVARVFGLRRAAGEIRLLIPAP